MHRVPCIPLGVYGIDVVSMKKETYKAVIQHISRLEGQLASVKQSLQTEHPDCDTTAKTLHAASRSFASLREAFVSCVLEHKFVDAKTITTAKNAKEFTSLLSIIRG
ncbi:MAG: hypothetical protein QG626_809 [Patescibacteria group bacterium]|nr:hypothetical protein [Patescibacteria group bacterium]